MSAARPRGAGQRADRADRNGLAGRDRGSGTVLLLAVVSVALTVLMATALLVGAQRARGAAQTAADLGALAAAGWLADRPGPPSAGAACAVARAVVARNDAVLTGCRAEGDGVVTVATARRAPGAGVARATARAGPAAVRDAS